MLLFYSDIAEYVNASFETNPLDGKCDQRIRLNVQPLEVIYHAVSGLMFCFGTVLSALTPVVYAISDQGPVHWDWNGI